MTQSETVNGMDVVRQWVETSPFGRHVGVQLSSVEPDRAELVLPFADTLPTLADVVHGGAIGTLVDMAAAAAAWATTEAPANLRGTTVDISLTFLAAAHGEDLRARAEVLRRGRNLCFCQVDVVNPGGESVARALVTYKLG